jgi:hypothetical protein
MPLARKGLTLEDALLEAAAFAPVSRVMLSCYELWHPSFSEPIYLVRDYSDFTARLESDAPRNASEEVTFLAAWFRFTRATESDQSDSPRVTVSIDNVSGLMSRALATARGSRDLWELIERVYASDVTTGPAVTPPLRVNLTDLELSGATCTAQALYADPVNVAVPTRLFTPEKYAGLVAR